MKKPDYPLLGLLARKPASGYDIGKWLRTDGTFLGRRPSMTPIYRALNNFLERGWVSVTVDPRDSAPAAKVYRLTPEGRQALLDWAASPYEPAARPMAPDFSVRLQFAGQMGPAYALAVVRTELEFRRRQRAEEADPTPDDNTEPIPEIDPQWLYYIDAKAKERGWQTTSWFIGWLETTERELSRLAAQHPEPSLPLQRSTTTP